MHIGIICIMFGQFKLVCSVCMTGVFLGPDWQWSNQDGGDGRLGTVLEVDQGADGKLCSGAYCIVVQYS